MKLSFSSLSIRFKVIILIVFISTVTLLISAFLFFLYDKSQFKTKTFRDLNVLAEVIGDNNTGNLSFDSKKEAQKSLESLRAESQISHAVIFSKDLVKFAEYKKTDANKLPDINIKEIQQELNKEAQNSLTISKKIYDRDRIKKEVIGYIYLYSELTEYNKRRDSFISYLSWLLLYTVLGIIVFSLLLQRFISKPIIELSKAMNEVTLKRDFSLRVNKMTDDEIGKLCDGFNNMLTEINTQNIALQDSKSKAENADSSKSVFLSNMSHEIRTPLNAIIGFSDLLINKTLAEKDRSEYTYYINTSSKLLLQLINDIIDFAKIESGQLKINKTETPVNFILGELKSSFSEDIKIKGKDKLELRLKAESKNLIINTDQLRLKQVLNNLLNNAIKFTTEGYIEFGYNFKDNETLLFYVKDTGIGINKDKLGIIFERFKQAKDSDSNVYGGTGLGLSICKNLVEALGGTIWAESIPGKGSAFYFTLPV